MWSQNYTPVGGSLALSALAAAFPLVVILLLLGLWRKPAWLAGLGACGAAFVIALGVYQMPLSIAVSSALYGAAYGILPIGWIVFSAMLLYRLTVETGKFEIIKDSVAHITTNQHLQALLVAFAFGAFIEGAAGFGTPVAVASAMLVGLGFSPFYAASICLLANTSPVAFGSIGTPLVMLQTVTNLPLKDLSADVGRLCAPLSLFIPAYLVLVMGGLPALRAALPAAAVCGIVFAGTQFFVSNYIGPYLTDILGSLFAMLALVFLLRVWHPASSPREERHLRHSAGQIMAAWTPYMFLVVFVLMWQLDAVKAVLAGLGVAEGQIRTEAFGTVKRDPAAKSAVSPEVAGKVFFQDSNTTAPVFSGSTILDAADQAGVFIDNACRSGTCGSCRVKLAKGAVQMAVEDALSGEDKTEGYILACQAEITGDVVIDA